LLKLGRFALVGIFLCVLHRKHDSGATSLGSLAENFMGKEVGIKKTASFFNGF